MNLRTTWYTNPLLCAYATGTLTAILSSFRDREDLAARGAVEPIVFLPFLRNGCF